MDACALLMDHEPPDTDEASATVLPVQTVAEPVIVPATGSGFTVITTIAVSASVPSETDTNSVSLPENEVAGVYVRPVGVIAAPDDVVLNEMEAVPWAGPDTRLMLTTSPASVSNTASDALSESEDAFSHTDAAIRCPAVK
jgi:hypothetical protein